MALCGLLYRVGPYRTVVLNLFYLPVVLAAFYLGRYRAGILALFCVISAAVITALDLNTLAAFTSPLAVGLALTIWGAVMGINSLLVGTLSDERMDKIKELHDAYVGVVEVLARYLNSSDPKVCDRTAKVAQLSQEVAAQMRLSDKEIDDIRVAALLQDIENIEVTARVIRKAVGDLAQPGRKKQLEHTFHGSELVQSLGSVLTGALPLLGNRGEYPDLGEADASNHAAAEHGFGAQIIRTVRAYVTLLISRPVDESPRGTRMRWKTVWKAIIIRPLSTPSSRLCFMRVAWQPGTRKPRRSWRAIASRWANEQRPWLSRSGPPKCHLCTFLLLSRSLAATASPSAVTLAVDMSGRSQSVSPGCPFLAPIISLRVAS